jgi:mannose-1-phosphate guanylyltransferase
MKALLLAAGLGTRLSPLTQTIPKCLVPVKGNPLLVIWFEQLSKAGISHFLVNTHYLTERVEEFVAACSFREKVTLAYEKKLLGTAGTLIANLDFFEGQDGMLIHADNYCLDDLHGFLEAHKRRPSSCLMTMMTFRTETPQSCGIVELNEHGVVVGLHEKVANPPGNLANGAVYLLSTELLSTLAWEFRLVSDFSTEVLQQLVGRIYTYETQELFMDIGTPEAYRRANDWNSD